MTSADGTVPPRPRRTGREAGTVEISSLLDAPADRVWRDVTDLARVNQELLPWMRMTRPRGQDVLLLDRARLGETLFRSWLLLGGVLPVDLDDLTIVELEPGRRFLERSRMLSATSWEHERLVEPVSGSTCRLTDRLRFVPRSTVHRHVLDQVVPRLFTHRHARLRHRYGKVRTSRG